MGQSNIAERANGLLSAGRAQAAVDLLIEAAKRGNGDALYELALWHVYGTPVPRSFAAARALFEKAGAAGHLGELHPREVHREPRARPGLGHRRAVHLQRAHPHVAQVVVRAAGAEAERVEVAALTVYPSENEVVATLLGPDGEVRFADDGAHVGERLPELLAGQTGQVVPLTAADGAQRLRAINPVPNRAACANCHGDPARHPLSDDCQRRSRPGEVGANHLVDLARPHRTTGMVTEHPDRAHDQVDGSEQPDRVVDQLRVRCGVERVPFEGGARHASITGCRLLGGQSA